MTISGSNLQKDLEKGNVRIRNMLASIERTFLPVNSTIGKYRIIEEVDRGGMAVVYKALQLDLDREVALKVMPANITINRRFVERFLTEAHAIAKLNHPNIVSIHEVAVEHNIYYLAMDYIPGKNLYYYLHYKKPKLVDVLEIISRLADALAYSHSQKIIHRDLKLNNVIMKDNLTPVLIDFGLAKALENDDNVEGITRTGEIMGSPSYMAPERLLGGIVDHRSDICSLGIMLYEMLTFKNPYLDQRNLHQTTINVMEATPIPPSKLIPWLPIEIEAITLKAMAKNVEDRYQSMEEFKADINRYQKGEVVLARPPSLWSKIRHFFKKHWPSIVIFTLVALFISLFSLSMYIQGKKGQSYWQLIYTSKCSSKNDLQEWHFSPDISNSNGNWKLENGKLVGRKLQGLAFARFEKPLNRDILFECDIDSDSMNLYNAGIFFYADHPDSGYCFILNRDGHGEHGITFPQSNFLFHDVNPCEVTFTKNNHIKIERIQNSLTFSINGKVVSRVRNNLPPLGTGHERIGFFVENGTASFDNIKVYRRATPQAPGPTLIADRFFDRGDFDAAIDEYKSLLLDLTDANAARKIQLKIVDCLVRLNRFDEALELLENSEVSKSRDETVLAQKYFWEGIVFSKTDRVSEADSVSRILAAKYPSNPVNISAMTSTVLRCSALLDKNEPELFHSAIDVLAEQYKRYPELWGKLYLDLIDYYLNSFMPDSAISITEKILGINSTDIAVKAKIALGQAYLDKGKTNEALEVFDQCITAYLNSPMVWNGWMKLAGIYEYDFQYKDAVTIYQKIFRECSRSSQIPWIAAIKIGEILYRDSSQYGDSLFSLVVSGEHPFPGPRLIAQFYLGQITESTFKTEWNRLFPGSRLYLYYFARKAVFRDESVVATLYLKEFRNNLSKKSWDYFRTIKILNNLNRW